MPIPSIVVELAVQGLGGVDAVRSPRRSGPACARPPRVPRRRWPPRVDRRSSWRARAPRSSSTLALLQSPASSQALPRASSDPCLVESVEQRNQALVVGDRGLVGVGGLRSLGRPSAGTRASCPRDRSARSGARGGARRGPGRRTRCARCSRRPGRGGRSAARTGRLSYATSCVTTCLNIQAWSASRSSATRSSVPERVEVADDRARDRRAPGRRRAASAPRTRARRRWPPSSFAAAPRPPRRSGSGPACGGCLAAGSSRSPPDPRRRCPGRR